MLCALGNGECLCNHDEILLKAPIEAADEVALILKDTMEEAGGALLKIAPVEAEVVSYSVNLDGDRLGSTPPRILRSCVGILFSE
jgi:hypothetical protein